MAQPRELPWVVAERPAGTDTSQTVRSAMGHGSRLLCGPLQAVEGSLFRPARRERAAMGSRRMQRILAGLIGLLLLVTVLGMASPGGVSAQDATPVPSTTAATAATSGTAATGAVTAAEQQLADKYAPIAMLKSQTAACDKA